MRLTPPDSAPGTSVLQRHGPRGEGLFQRGSALAGQAALQAIYHEGGFAGSLLAFELSDGRLKLIAGHLRREIDPDMEVEVEVFDINEDEVRTLLASDGAHQVEMLGWFQGEGLPCRALVG